MIICYHTSPTGHTLSANTERCTRYTWVLPSWKVQLSYSLKPVNMGIWRRWWSCNRNPVFEPELHCFCSCFPRSWVSYRAIQGILTNAFETCLHNTFSGQIVWSHCNTLTDTHMSGTAGWIIVFLIPSRLWSDQEDMSKNRLSEEESCVNNGIPVWQPLHSSIAQNFCLTTFPQQAWVVQTPLCCWNQLAFLFAK